MNKNKSALLVLAFAICVITIVAIVSMVLKKTAPEIQSTNESSLNSTTNIDTSLENKQTEPVTNVNPTPSSSVKEEVKAPTVTSYTMTDVAKHNSESSCYTAINGVVYDVTSWIRQHPGGARAILSLCGKDGSSAFNDQHGGQRRPENELAGFKIGILK
jgi:cytochrome b involved in lipid metabolism